jgi:hypothetical protein
LARAPTVAEIADAKPPANYHEKKQLKILRMREVIQLAAAQGAQ